MQISKRLEAVAGMVTPGCIVADIGTDHAYIPIYLVSGGIIPKALAMDVNRGPLNKAVVHITQYGLEHKIETRLSDGLAAMKPYEAESIVIAGMGGPLTVKILSEGAEQAAAARELILQPQSEIRQVRAYLEENQYRIIQEELILEEGKFYPMMKAVRDTQDCIQMNEAQLRYGPLLMEQRHPVLREYLLREQQLNRKILQAMEGQQTEGAAARRAEVEAELSLIQAALELFTKGE